MSFVLDLDLPSRRAAQAMLERVAADERVTPGDDFGALPDTAPETATVLRVAARAGVALPEVSPARRTPRSR